jgi:hypothetical protein
MKKALFFIVCLCFAINMMAQTKTITGVVVDATGEPVIGASVLEVGTTNGTITDVDGNFTIQVPVGAKLDVSYIGYKTQQIVVGVPNTYKVILKEDAEMLDEVVERESEETELFVETETPEPVQAESTEAETEEPLVIETETGTSVNDREQEIQETPEKTEEEKPSEPPALSEGTATDQPDTPPSYEEEKQEEPAPAENQTPKTGDTKDGMVYVEGFGWITDEGEGSGTYADDMYENGNKIGIMD